jgi:regulatory protein
MSDGYGREATEPPGHTVQRRQSASRRRSARQGRSERDESPDSGTSRPDPEKDDPESVARIICLRMLTAAPRTQAELAKALRRRGVPDDAAQTVLERFADVKLIDDAMFARAWVESRHHSRGLSSRALSAELRKRGVAQEDIAQALDELDPEQEVATARDLVARRLEATRGQPGPARMRRLTGLLARKGYPAGLAYRVVREALENEAVEIGTNVYYLRDMHEPDAEDEAAEY